MTAHPRAVWLISLALCVACGPTRMEGTEVGDCTDEADNDGDGDFDCDDTGCAGHPSCVASGDAGIRDAGSTPEDAGPEDAGQGDGGSPDTDAGPPLGGACGDVTTSAISETMTGLVVRTDDASNTVATCGALDAAGNERFVPFSLQAGDVWHFHVHPDPSEPGSAERDPIVYLLDDACDPRACDASSEQCDASGDEHFTFVVPATGRYYLGVDDRRSGGGVYRLEAVRGLCGNGVVEHGEACDGGGDCTDACRAILEPGPPSLEIEPNDNAVEANELEGIAAAGARTISGTLGGGGCAYPDVFTTLVEEGRGVSVRAELPSGAPCDSGAATPFELTLRDAAWSVRAAPMTDANGCAALDVPGLAAGRYFLVVEPTDRVQDPFAYRLATTIEAP